MEEVRYHLYNWKVEPAEQRIELKVAKWEEGNTVFKYYEGEDGSERFFIEKVIQFIDAEEFLKVFKEIVIIVEEPYWSKYYIEKIGEYSIVIHAIDIDEYYNPQYGTERVYFYNTIKGMIEFEIITNSDKDYIYWYEGNRIKEIIVVDHEKEKIYVTNPKTQEIKEYTIDDIRYRWIDKILSHAKPLVN